MTTDSIADGVWRAEDTSPSDIEAALRALLAERHRENESFVPARVLNLVCVVDKEWSGEIANRLRRVGRYHASRTVVCSIEPRRRELRAMASIAGDANPKPGEIALTRETVVIDVGPQHAAHLDTIVDPLVITDLPTLLWSPHGHREAVDSLLGIAQIVLLDSVDEPDPKEALARATELSESVYVVDLAWLRSTPWRERIAATFDPVALRPDLKLISKVVVHHHVDSTVAAALFIGWLGSRLGWDPAPLMDRGGSLTGKVHSRRQDVEVVLEASPELTVRGLAGIELETASGRHLELVRGDGGLLARYRNRRGDERTWTVLGASRGEAGILGEGIRQALLRDPTYAPALRQAGTLLG